MQGLHIPQRTIMTPGPVEVHPRVRQAMSNRMLGQFDPAFTSIMDETMERIRQAFQTKNKWAFPVDGTSRAGIEAVMCSLIEPGDKVLIPIFGRFGHLMAEIAERSGAEVFRMHAEWGTVFDPEDVIAEIKKISPKIVGMIHGDTSTGRVQPLEAIGKACRSEDVLLVVDAVATITGMDFKTDDWCIDAVIGGTQKCLSVPSGLAPLTYNDRVEKVIAERKNIEQGLVQRERKPNPRRIHSNYFDLTQLQDYWSESRLNHHTEATHMIYGLHEGLQVVLEEGLEERFNRHRYHEQALTAGLEAMGLKLFGDPASKLTTVTCITIPEGIDGDQVRDFLLQQFGIEIASSFGPLQGKIWRIGTMGYSCRQGNVLQVLMGLEASLIYAGAAVHKGEAARAALDIYTKQIQPSLA
ncbi:(S)-ureidoglycine-glyoxylate aminotransferase [Sinobaca qinghaiensis]|uniref:(S)-ureidoglycine-glyoxylate aminotransferase n=1 Tax=Sinobaca qinghaiensis TaxID=342944 RepID=A0A419V4H0_9BACL|nr:alanine--glyoxylate aminotransferase family protein [Sinobaca qinghaiensis]RKD73419.1 (S)-ureidoglycine-glyoxylate aminotransferase [Sinobaca qinghaiensis]